MKCRFFRAKSVDTRIRALAGLSDDELARLGQVDRYERTPEGSPNRLTVRRKPRDQSVLKMLSPHFSRTYGDRLQHQHSGIISVMPVGCGGKSQLRKLSAS
jgi:hypothetical protein